MDTKLLDLINSLLQEIGMDKLDSLTPTHDLKEDMGLDSISYADLIVQIDEAFGVNINSGDAINTVQDVLDRLAQ